MVSKPAERGRSGSVLYIDVIVHQHFQLVCLSSLINSFKSCFSTGAMHCAGNSCGCWIVNPIEDLIVWRWPSCDYSNKQRYNNLMEATWIVSIQSKWWPERVALGHWGREPERAAEKEREAQAILRFSLAVLIAVTKGDTDGGGSCDRWSLSRE